MGNDSKYRVLWVCHDFPPRKTSGIYRPVKIYKYIDKKHYKIDFLTQYDFHKKDEEDQSLLNDLLPEPTIYRVPNIVFDELISAIYRRIKTKNADQFGTSKKNGHQSQIKVDKHKITRSNKAYRFFISLCYFPDEYFIWGWLATWKALRLYLKNRYDLVYTTSSPQSGHLAGIILKCFGVKWVADYRDGGILCHKWVLGYPKKNIREKIEFYYQRHVFRRADHVIAHSEILRRDFCNIFSIPSDKITAISNGYDDDDFIISGSTQLLPFVKQANEIHLLHLGTWYLNNEEHDIIRTNLNNLADSLKEKDHFLVIHGIGRDIFGKDRHSNQLRFSYHFHGSITHSGIISYLMSADCYLLATTTLNSCGGFLPGKLWEYLRGGKPIIIFGSRDEAWDITHEAGVGYYLGPDNAGHDTLVHRLLNSATENKPVPETIQRYRWESRAQSLQAIFKMILER